MLPAGGAPEIELCQQLQKFGRKETGLDQYAIAKFAESLEVTALPKHLGKRMMHVPNYSLVNACSWLCKYEDA